MGPGYSLSSFLPFPELFFLPQISSPAPVVTYSVLAMLRGSVQNLPPVLNESKTQRENVMNDPIYLEKGTAPHSSMLV